MIKWDIRTVEFTEISAHYPLASALDRYSCDVLYVNNSYIYLPRDW